MYSMYSMNVYNNYVNILLHQTNKCIILSTIVLPCSLLLLSTWKFRYGDPQWSQGGITLQQNMYTSNKIKLPYYKIILHPSRCGWSLHGNSYDVILWGSLTCYNL
jgi:hypothetical protein